MTTTLRLTAPSRLHFGLLGWGAEAPRQFGSVGLMIRDPGLEIEARPGPALTAEGPLSGRAIAVARRVIEVLNAEGRIVPPMELTIRRAPPEHVGLGTGTQLSLAVARLLMVASGEPETTAARLQALTGRGLRSGIGLHGSLQGGLLVDGGRGNGSPFPPLLARMDLPEAWSILLVIPPIPTGLAGPSERDAFARLADVPTRRIDRICRLVLLGMLPAVAEGDLLAFGAALAELQHEVGDGFRAAQGGMFANPILESIAHAMTRSGLHGVGQSSWGPTLYGFCDENGAGRRDILINVQRSIDLDSRICLWTSPWKTGAELTGTAPAS